jgi:hypothetical protein
LAAARPDRRDPARIHHRFTEIIGARVFGICCGWEDAIDHNQLRDDPALKMAVGRCPETGAPLASQSTISRFENAPSKWDAGRLARALVDQFTAHVTPAYRDIFDIDDTFDAAHGGQQMTFWNAHYDERGFAPMHIYHAGSGLPVATILRTAKTPAGQEVRTVWYKAGSWSAPRRVIARIEASMHPDPTPDRPDGMRQEIDVRYVVTSLEGDPERLYEGVYCQRGQMENLIKLHKAQLASDRTSCHSATANQVRLSLHTAAFWLMHTVRSLRSPKAIRSPKPSSTQSVCAC